MTSRRLFSRTVVALTVLISLQCAHAMRLSPLDPSFTALGPLPGGNLTVNTGSGGGLPSLNYSGGMLTGDVVVQAGAPDIAVFVFDGGATLAAGDSLNISGGDRGLALLFMGSAAIDGTIDVSGTGGTNGNGAGGGNNGIGGAGGPGGFAGGNGYDAIGGFNATGAQHGTGFGRGIAGNSPGNPSGRTAGGGGGYGTSGDQPFSAPGWGVAHGDLLTVLQGGSGGGGGGGNCCTATWDGGGGGGGGGVVEIGALTDLIITGTILADAGDGGAGGGGGMGGGGGAGGGILLHAYNVELTVSALLSADGGLGGACGGGGRTAVVTNTNGTFTNNGTVQARKGRGVCPAGQASLALSVTTATDVGVIPIPAPLLLFASALGALGWLRRKAL